MSQLLRVLVLGTLLVGAFAECGEDEWTCDDGSCIVLLGWCDGEGDCPDLSDEATCTCPTGEQLCPQGDCIPNAYLCDGQTDCPGGEDELNCESDSDYSFPLTAEEEVDERTKGALIGGLLGVPFAGIVLGYGVPYVAMSGKLTWRGLAPTLILGVSVFFFLAGTATDEWTTLELVLLNIYTIKYTITPWCVCELKALHICQYIGWDCYARGVNGEMKTSPDPIDRCQQFRSVRSLTLIACVLIFVAYCSAFLTVTKPRFRWLVMSCAFVAGIFGMITMIMWVEEVDNRRGIFDVSYADYIITFHYRWSFALLVCGWITALIGSAMALPLLPATRLSSGPAAEKMKAKPNPYYHSAPTGTATPSQQDVKPMSSTATTPTLPPPHVPHSKEPSASTRSNISIELPAQRPPLVIRKEEIPNELLSYGGVDHTQV